MVWCGICLGARTELVVVNGALNADEYIRDVLQEHMHDNACPHKARCVSDFFNVVGIRTMAWPACSPDIDPIEHAWDMLSRRLKSITSAVQNSEQVAAALVEIWDNLPKDMIDNVIRSMRRRMTAVIRARGGHTRY